MWTTILERKTRSLMCILNNVISKVINEQIFISISMEKLHLKVHNSYNIRGFFLNKKTNSIVIYRYGLY